MTVETHWMSIRTTGNAHVVDLSSEIAECLSSSAIYNGIATIFAVGSTASITTTEYEPGLATQDLKSLYEMLAPEDGDYLHEKTWGDDNGHSHVRATLTGPSITVPLVDGQLTLGTWQQIILLDFDTRSRNRKIVMQLMGE
ncbi:secondary thiamine-phosphate synthase enzyme YjbQ [Oligoflexia bacterium]|nr:secondary thiamine-phosphate synthase enzyme YjbQ [Oligoflexia bacterium]